LRRADHSSKESNRLCKKKSYETEKEARAQQRAVETLMNEWTLLSSVNILYSSSAAVCGILAALPPLCDLLPLHCTIYYLHCILLQFNCYYSIRSQELLISKSSTIINGVPYVCIRGGLLQPLHLDPQWCIVLNPYDR
jgi:hypothetical protein